MNLTSLETPRLILDKPKLIHNIEKYNDQIKRLGIQSRPHGKTAKNIDILKLCHIDQNPGITVSTLMEAEYYFKNGIRDIIYAVGIAPVKLDRVINLIKAGCHLSIIFDSIEQAKAVNLKACHHNIIIPVYIEIDSDGQRAGVVPQDPLLIDLGKVVHMNKGTELRGVLTHAGASYKSLKISDIKKVAALERDNTVKAAEMLKKSGLPCPVVSIGSTPTVTFAEDLTGVTEVRAGVYMFMDLVMAGLGVCRTEDIAISVLASVIGHQKTKDWVIVDTGWTSLSRDLGNSNQGYGLVCDVEGQPLGEYIVSATSQEHGVITQRERFGINWDKFPIGSMVRILPNHSCATATMFNSYHVVDNSLIVSDIWSRANGWY